MREEERRRKEGGTRKKKGRGEKKGSKLRDDCVGKHTITIKCRKARGNRGVRSGGKDRMTRKMNKIRRQKMKMSQDID